MSDNFRAMNCPQCQRELPADAVFCSHCGVPTVRVEPGETIRNAPSTNPQAHLKQQSPDEFHDSSEIDPRIGLVLDSKYELIERLGQGGMGAVYRARRLHIGDEVAVKLLSHELVREQHALERFRREARSAAMIRHPNVVSIHDFNDGKANGESYIVMELVKGQSLRSLLEREGVLPAERAVALMRDICAGVGVAHRQGLLHRDLKPDNVIVTPPTHEGEEESAKVVDFGLAKIRDAANTSALTRAGVLMGTLYYMSPEQCRGEELDPRADVYSLGAMLYEMLSGGPPFRSENMTGMISKHLHDPPRAFDSTLQVPPALARACLRALAKNRNERPADAIAFAHELTQALHAPAEHAAPVDMPSNVPEGRQTRTASGLKWVIAIVGAAVAVVVLIGIGVALKFGADRIFAGPPAQQPASKAVPDRPVSASETNSGSTAVSDLRGKWTGTYGPAGQPATLIINSQDGQTVDGVLEQGGTRVAFSGTIDSGTIHLKQSKVLAGEGWSLGEDTGTVTADGKTMSGTGKDAFGGSLGMTYQWTFSRSHEQDK